MRIACYNSRSRGIAQAHLYILNNNDEFMP